jgi:hypothetical protein
MSVDIPETGPGSAPPVPLPSSADHHDPADHHDTKPAVRRLVIVLALLALCVVTFGSARKVLPPEQIIGDPQSYSIQIQSAGPTADSAGVFFTFSQLSGGLVEIQFSVVGYSAAVRPGHPFAIDTRLELPGSGIKWTRCPEPNGCSVKRSSAGNQTVIQFNLPPVTPTSSTFPSTTMTAIVQDPSLALTYDRESAIVEMPYVTLEYHPTVINGSRVPFSIFLSYAVPGAHDFQWSKAPYSRSSNQVQWVESPASPPLGQGNPIQPAEVTGTNHIAQLADTQSVFYAGILFGIAGAAALAATVEFLHLILKVY